MEVLDKFDYGIALEDGLEVLDHDIVNQFGKVRSLVLRYKLSLHDTELSSLS